MKRGWLAKPAPRGCAQSWHQTLSAHNTVTFLWVSLFRQEPGQLLRKQRLSARRKVAERKESTSFFYPGWRSLRSQAMCRALVPSVWLSKGLKSQQEAEAEGQAMWTRPGIQRKGEATIWSGPRCTALTPGIPDPEFMAEQLFSDPSC